MKPKLINHLQIWIFSLMIALTFNSCENFEFPVDSSFSRLFSPVTFSSGIVTATGVELIFSKVTGANKYVIEMSEDSLLFSNIVRTIEMSSDTLQFADGSTTQYVIKLTNLNGGVQYSARLKSVSTSGEIPESKWAETTFKTKSEQIFQNIITSEKTDISVILRWNATGADVTQIQIVSTVDASIITVQLTDADKTASMKLIEGLSGSTTYTANIYNGENKRGTLTFRTNESVPSEGIVIRLTGGEDIYSLLQTQSGDITLVMPAGSVYATSWLDASTSATSYSLPLNDNITSLTFWGVEGDVQAKLNCTAIKVGAGLSKLSFKNIEYTGNSNSADYLLNENVTRALTQVSFTNCKIHTVRGVVRLQNDANYTSLDKVSFVKCIIYDLGNYGVTNTSAANVKLLNLEIKESTLYNMTDALGNFKNTANSVLIDACTFYNCFGNGKYIFNFNTSFIPNSFVISNCIFGKFNSTVFDGTQTLRATSPKITTAFMVDSYKTNDCLINAGYPMTGIIEYSGASTDLFTDPSAYNFKLKDSAFGGFTTAGDLRWR